jgi:hypothetical protein
MCQPVTRTPSAPFSKALRTNDGASIPEHISRMSRILGGYCSRLTPARSAPAYEHQLQAKAMIFGSKFAFMRSPRLALHFVNSVMYWGATAGLSSSACFGNTAGQASSGTRSEFVKTFENHCTVRLGRDSGYTDFQTSAASIMSPICSSLKWRT